MQNNSSPATNNLKMQSTDQSLPINLLVDHGAYQNVGDASMLEAVVARCRWKFPWARLFIVRGDFPSPIWQQENVVSLAPYLVRPMFKKIMWSLWKKQYYGIDKFLSALFMAIYSRTAGATVVYTEHQKLRMNEFCDRFDGYLITGGGNLNDIFYKVLFEKLILIKGFSQQNKPVMLTGQQLGPINSGLYKNAAMKIFKEVSFMGLRDPGDSVELCRKAGLSPEQFRVMGDDSLYYPPATQSVVQEWLKANDLISGRFIAVNLRIAWYAIADKRVLSNVIAALKELSEALSMLLLFVPISWAEHDSDYKAAKLLQSELESMRILQPFCHSPAIIKGLLAHAFGSIGTSFHFCTFSLSQGVPAVCVYQSDYYAQKARSLELFWQETGMVWDMQNLTKSGTGRIIEYMTNDFVRDRLLKKSKRAKLEWQYVFDTQLLKLFGCHK